MVMKDMEYFEIEVREECTPTLDKDKLYSAMRDCKTTDMNNKFRFRKAILVGVMLVVLATGAVFGEDIFHYIKNKEGETIFALRKDTETELACVEEDSKYLNSKEVIEFKQKIKEQLKPGEIVAYVDMERPREDPNDFKISFLHEPMKIDSIDELRKSTVTPFKVLNEELSGYEFVEASINYDFGGYDEIRNMEDVLINKAKENNERFEFMLVETTKEAMDINLTYKNSQDHIIYIHISPKVMMVTKPKLDDSLIKEIKIDDIKVLYDELGREFFYKVDDTLYTISSSTSSGFTKESIANIIHSLE